MTPTIVLHKNGTVTLSGINADTLRTILTHADLALSERALDDVEASMGLGPLGSDGTEAGKSAVRRFAGWYQTMHDTIKAIDTAILTAARRPR